MMFQFLSIYLLAMNLLLFVLMGIDKQRAKRGKWRIRERTLFTIALAGGSIGGIAGMQLFRHKTRHNSFKYGFPAILIAELAVVGYVIWQFWIV